MKKIQDNPDLYCYDLNNASSSTDCTGLIPTPPQSEEELASYDAIFHRTTQDDTIQTKTQAETQTKTE